MIQSCILGPEITTPRRASQEATVDYNVARRARFKFGLVEFALASSPARAIGRLPNTPINGLAAAV